MKINLLNNDNITDEYILYQYNYLKDDIIKAINIVKNYIIQHKLVIVGGTAIDYALRLQNDKIYNEEYQIPDFDIISPNNVEHANNIGTILCNEKFNNISIIPAIHNTTVRVKLLGFTVFDSTFIPEYLYNKIPKIQYKNFQIIDPLYQKINQYLSMSFLFKNNGMNYNISDRLIKDYERFNKIDKYYNFYTNIDPNKIIDIKYNKIKINLDINANFDINIYNKSNKINTDFDKKINLLLNNSEIYGEINNNICFHGIIAYNLIYNEFNKLLDNIKEFITFNNEDTIFIENKLKYILIKPDITITNQFIEMDIIDNLPLVFINSNNSINEIYNNLKKNNTNITELKKIDNIIDIIPKKAILSIKNNNKNIPIEIYDLYGDLLSINIINKNIPLIISNYIYNLSYFLFNYYYSNDDIKIYYLYYYISLKSIIDIIKYINTKYTTKLSKFILYDNSIYSLSINTFGKINYANNYYYFIKNYYHLVHHNTNLNVLPPKNYIDPPKCDITKIFDKKNSLYYKEDLLEIEHTNDSNEINTLIHN
jgi:hypothetical protein